MAHLHLNGYKQEYNETVNICGRVFYLHKNVMKSCGTQIEPLSRYMLHPLRPFYIGIKSGSSCKGAKVDARSLHQCVSNYSINFWPFDVRHVLCVNQFIDTPSRGFAPSNLSIDLKRLCPPTHPWFGVLRSRKNQQPGTTKKCGRPIKKGIVEK